MNCSAKEIHEICPLINDFDKIYAQVKIENFERLEAIKKKIIASALIPVLFPKGFPARETLLRTI